MNPLHDIAEAKIRDAIEAGEFEGLPGRGRPLSITDDSRVPAELRGAYSVLRTAGMLPEEMELKKSMVSLRDLIEHVTEDDERARLESRMRDLSVRFDLLMQKRRGAGLSLGSYRSAAMRRFL